MTDERVKKQYINDKRLAVVTRIVCAMIEPMEYIDARALDEHIIDAAYEFAHKILGRESDLQAQHYKWLKKEREVRP